MDRTRLIFTDGKAGAADHGFQLVLRQADPLVGLDLRQLRVIFGRHGRDGKRGNAAADGDLELFVDRNTDGIARQLPDDVEEETGGHNAGASLLDLGVDGDGDARFKIITGKRQLYASPDINSFERRNGALLRDGTGSDGDGAHQRIFFTGKFHGTSSVSSFKRKKGYFLEVRSSRGILCGKAVFSLTYQRFFIHRQVCRKKNVINTHFCETSVSQLSTESVCGFHRGVWTKSELAVDVGRNVADVVGERSGACGKLLLDLFERVNDGRMVTAKFLADVGQA